VVIGGAVAQAASNPIIVTISETENRRLNMVLLLLEWAKPGNGKNTCEFGGSAKLQFGSCTARRCHCGVKLRIWKVTIFTFPRVAVTI
jgi:hypothetical protein